MTPLVSGGTGAIALRLAFSLFLNVVSTHHTLGYIRGPPAISDVARVTMTHTGQSKILT
jgi:hypothetical protein